MRNCFGGLPYLAARHDRFPEFDVQLFVLFFHGLRYLEFHGLAPFIGFQIHNQWFDFHPTSSINLRWQGLHG